MEDGNRSYSPPLKQDVDRDIPIKKLHEKKKKKKIKRNKLQSLKITHGPLCL